jgi:MinD superfamily P-loop ATPase
LIKIAVASGKGGTGKTLISTNLAYIASKKMKVSLYDLDVEEPNSHLFLQKEEVQPVSVEMMIPVVNDDKCTYCGICSKVCEYHAIITLAKNVMVFPELCHSCYGCLEMCPTGAISEGFKSIGEIFHSQNDNLNLITGKLKVSESATTALIAKTKNEKSENVKLAIYDSPPGTSCPVIEATKDMDYIILVSEPTLFGVHDLDLVVQTIKQLNRPFGIIINKAEKNNTIIDDYCKENAIEIIAKIPIQDEIAHTYARGGLIVENVKGTEAVFEKLLHTVLAKAGGAVI